jgi:hypothetical protein
LTGSRTALSRNIFNAAIRSRSIRRSYHELACPVGVELHPVETGPPTSKRKAGKGAQRRGHAFNQAVAFFITYAARDWKQL